VKSKEDVELMEVERGCSVFEVTIRAFYIHDKRLRAGPSHIGLVTRRYCEGAMLLTVLRPLWVEDFRSKGHYC